MISSSLSRRIRKSLSSFIDSIHLFLALPTHLFSWYTYVIFSCVSMISCIYSLVPSVLPSSIIINSHRKYSLHFCLRTDSIAFRVSDFRLYVGRMIDMRGIPTIFYITSLLLLSREKTSKRKTENVVLSEVISAAMIRQGRPSRLYRNQSLVKYQANFHDCMVVHVSTLHRRTDDNL